MLDAFNNIPKPAVSPPGKPVTSKTDEGAKPTVSRSNSNAAKSPAPNGNDTASVIAQVAKAQFQASQKATATQPRFDLSQLDAGRLNASTLAGLRSGNFSSESKRDAADRGVSSEFSGGKLSGGAKTALVDAVAANLAAREDDDGSVT